MSERSGLRIAHACVLDDNRAFHSGGHVFLQSSWLDIEGAHLIAGSSRLGGGAVYLEYRSMGRIRNSEISGSIACGGGGACAVIKSDLIIQETLIHANYAGCIDDSGEEVASGGGLLFHEAANVSVVRCRLESNNASGVGGGIWAGTDTNTTVLDTEFVGNAGQHGAAIGLSSSMARCTVRNASVASGLALGTGGGMYFTPHAQTAGTIALQYLHFYSNRAEVGENIYWNVPQNFSATCEPVCIGCTYPQGTDLFHTRAVTYHVLQQEVSVGGTTAGGLKSLSGERITPPLLYLALDYYGNATWLPDQYGITVTSDTAALSQHTFAEYLHGVGAEFSSLAVLSDPGRRVHLTFTPQTDKWEPVVVMVALQGCEPGEEHDAVAQLCRTCPEGSLKFDNSSAACEECVAGLECSGGNHFKVKPGYWVAPNTQHCGEDMECFMSRIYSCSEESACSTEGENSTEQRSGDSSASVGSLKLCNPAYVGGVLCGGSAVPVCSHGYRLSAAMQCSRCPSRLHSIFRFLWAMALALLLVAAICAAGVFIRSVSTDAGPMLQGLLFDMALPMQTMRGVIRIMTGYFQVVSQMQHIFQAQLPPILARFFYYAAFVDFLNMFQLAGMDCLLYRLGRNNRINFWFTYYSALCKPGLVLIVGAGILLALQLMKGSTKKERWSEFLSAVGSSIAVDIQRHSLCANHRGSASNGDSKVAEALSSIQQIVSSITMFLFMYIHPSVSTTIFQVLNCFNVHNNETEGSCPQAGCAYLHMDSSIRCYTFEWWFAITCGGVVIVVYVIGFPAGLAFLMFYLRRFAEVELAVPRDLACLGDILQLAHARQWIPLDDNGLSAAKQVHSHLLSLSHRKSAAAIQGSDTDVRSVTFDDSPFFLEMYVQQGTVTELGKTGKGGSATIKVCQSDVAGIDLSLMYAHEEDGHQCRPSALAVDDAPGIRISLPCGKVIAGLVRQKESHISGESKIWVDRTRLDDPFIAVILAQFHNNFQDRYFYWECVEITRQLWQTGMVLVVEICLDENSALVFVVFVAFTFAQFKGLNPYVHDPHNRLYGAILFNQFLLQVALMYRKLDAGYTELLDGILATVQVSIITFAAKALWDDGIEMYHLGVAAWKLHTENPKMGGERHAH